MSIVSHQPLTFKQHCERMHLGYSPFKRPGLATDPARRPAPDRMHPSIHPVDPPPPGRDRRSPRGHASARSLRFRLPPGGPTPSPTHPASPRPAPGRLDTRTTGAQCVVFSGTESHGRNHLRPYCCPTYFNQDTPPPHPLAVFHPPPTGYFFWGGGGGATQTRQFRNRSIHILPIQKRSIPENETTDPVRSQTSADRWLGAPWAPSSPCPGAPASLPPAPCPP